MGWSSLLEVWSVRSIFLPFGLSCVLQRLHFLWTLVADMENVGTRQVSFGSQSVIGARRSILCKNVASLIRINVCFVIKRTRQSSIFSLLVCLLANFGVEFLHLWVSMIACLVILIWYLHLGGESLARRLQKKKRKGFNSVIALSTWFHWNHRNAGVFENANPSLNFLAKLFEDEYHLWCLARAKGLRRLGLGATAA